MSLGEQCGQIRHAAQHWHSAFITAQTLIAYRSLLLTASDSVDNDRNRLRIPIFIFCFRRGGGVPYGGRQQWDCRSGRAALDASAQPVRWGRTERQRHRRVLLAGEASRRGDDARGRARQEAPQPMMVVRRGSHLQFSHPVLRRGLLIDGAGGRKAPLAQSIRQRA